MKICKSCGREKSLEEYSRYHKYPTKSRPICKSCIKKRANFYKESNKDIFLKDDEEVIREFNILKSADKILKLFQDGYDVSWSGEGTVIFSKGEKVIHGKNATKEIYRLIFARYCIEKSY